MWVQNENKMRSKKEEEEEEERKLNSLQRIPVVKTDFMKVINTLESFF